MKKRTIVPLALALIFSSTSCATTGLTTDKNQGRDMSEQSRIDPAELGRRFLAVIKSVDGFDELSADSVQRLMGVPFTTDGSKGSGFYVLKSPTDDREYTLTYNFDKKFPRYSNVKLEVSESGTENEATPNPCDLALKDYDASLKQLGFKAEPTSYNEFGWALAFYYSRNDIYAQVVPQNKALKSPRKRR
ncbi:hypothetical protein OCJ37_15080 [Xanthomonas sp. AM6]|uniref:hypothetical protein n=1 Tax=Xanthomonas sp. AM6 TaxID=2982531 RepID=UPI0021DADDE6|nr:hypothetical protein [Xanthomonas sp. AM6]UYB51304.1 hypothetical protein OCJ37_15080 [Xanthomonas sp. AM6]